MKREHLTAFIRTAGYHEDHATYTRLLVENRISLARASAAFREGQNARDSGVRCTCRACATRRDPRQDAMPRNLGTPSGGL